MPGFNKNYGGASVYVDISDLMDTINLMKNAMSTSSFEEMMRRTFNDAGKKVKTIVRKEVPKEYAVTAAWAGSAVGWPKSQGGAGKIGVVVPINGTRGSIGGRFKASGPRGRPKKGRRAKINAKILKGASSTMPDVMAHQGGQPPFMIGGVAFTRKYKGKSHPIVHVVGLGVPQMPINKSRDEVEKDIKEVVEKRLVHHFGQLFGK